MNFFWFPATDRARLHETPLCAKAGYLLVLGWVMFMALGDAQAQGNPLPIGGARPQAAAKAREPDSGISADEEMIQIPVTITDPEDRLVTGLAQADFILYENDAKQAIQSFAVEDAPVSIGIVVDLSGASAAKLEQARDSILAFLKAANPKDDFFVSGFNDRAAGWTGDRTGGETGSAGDFTSARHLQAQLAKIHGSGKIALLDAIHFGLERLKGAGNERKALLVISDGVEHRSQAMEQEVKAQVRESDVEIDSIGIFDAYTPATERRIALRLLNDLCEETGGWIFPVEDLANLADVAIKISTELRNQYVLGYHPKNLQRDGKWRKVKVKLAAQKELQQLTVHARTGYYAPLP